MKFSVIQIFTWIFIYFLPFYCKFSQCRESPVSVTISKIQDYFITNKRCVFPPVFILTINITHNTTLKLTLTRNEDAHHNSPIYMFRKSGNGHMTLIKQAELQPTKKFAYYQDSANTASIEVTCQKDDIIYPELMGTFVHGKKEYLLTPKTFSPNIHSHGSAPYLQLEYELTQINHHNHPLFHDYRTLPGFDTFDHLNSSPNSSPIVTSQRRHQYPVNRRRRQISIQRPYMIDILVVIDYEIYREWFNRARGATDEKKSERTKFELKRYFSHFLNGVDMRYRKIPNPELNFRVKLTGFVIADSEFAYRWTELRKEFAIPRNILDADIALKDFRSWINETNEIPPHDHAMLFTGYNLYTLSSNNTKLLHTSGLAFIGSMCRTNGDSVSIVEDHGGFQNVATAAHELGHSLGALHDGEKNECNSNNRYIMAASGYGPVPLDMRHNQWHFSNCSLRYFKNFTSNLARNGYTCLTETYSNASVVAASEMPGQLYSPDEQCRLIWGPKSYMCRGVEFGNERSICTAMYCRDPNTASDCVLHTAARGTSCGDKRWCVDGECIFSMRAPEKHENCVLGDQPGIAFSGQTCAELIEVTPAYCYQEKVKARCCDSCRKKYTWRKGCEYGDQIRGCQPWHCNDILPERNKCCGTCMLGKPIFTSPKQIPTDTPVTMTPHLTPPSTCIDKAFVNGQKCEDFVAINGHHLCYEERIQSFCCETCNAFRRISYPECPYGDKSPTICRIFSNSSTALCKQNTDNCCETCFKGNSNSATTNLRGTISIIVGLCLLSLVKIQLVWFKFYSSEM